MITPSDILKLAGRLALATSADAARFRASISRAYYSAFHATGDYLTSIAIHVGHNHGELQRSLLVSGVAAAQLAGRRLTDLHSFRIKADYDLRSSVIETRALAQECVERAADILAIIVDLGSEDVRQQVKAGIEAYRRKIGRG
jgi:uncharacterized protein (UPF0332 family)